MKILIDMNLPPCWVRFFAEHGIDATHWSVEGDPRAPDSEVLAWARQRNCVVFTHDLDFGILLSMAQEAGPSVIQIRTQDVTPEAIGSLVLTALGKHKHELDQGALLSIQAQTSRVRVLPIKKTNLGEPQ